MSKPGTADADAKDQVSPPISAADDKMEAEPRSAPIARKPKGGDRIHVVHAHKGHVEAQIDRVNKDGTIDLTFLHEVPQLRITSSPYGPTGVMSDSWHFPE